MVKLVKLREAEIVSVPAPVRVMRTAPDLIILKAIGEATLIRLITFPAESGNASGINPDVNICLSVFLKPKKLLEKQKGLNPLTLNYTLALNLRLNKSSTDGLQPTRRLGSLKPIKLAAEVIARESKALVC
jgi:hypothetical protein